MNTQFKMSKQTRALVLAVLKHAKKTSADEAIEQLKSLYLCTLDLETQSHNRAVLADILTHLQDPENPGIHMRIRIHEDLST